MITKPQCLRTLQFLRVLDGDNNISLTNVALVATLVRLLCVKDVQVQDLGMFAATMIGYQVKRFAAPTGAPESVTDLQDAVAKLQASHDEVQTKVSALQLSGQIQSQRR